MEYKGSKFVCDRCGQTAFLSECDKSNMRMWGEPWRLEHPHLCPDCNIQFKFFMEDVGRIKDEK